MSGSDSLRLAEVQKAMTADEFASWQQRLGLSNQEIIDLFDLSRTTINAYRRGVTAFSRLATLI